MRSNVCSHSQLWRKNVDVLNELSRTLDQTIEVGAAASAVMQKAEVRIDELELTAHRLVMLIEDTLENSEGVWPHPNTGCIVCTLGTVPNDRNTGLCAYHDARRILGLRS